MAPGRTSLIRTPLGHWDHVLISEVSCFQGMKVHKHAGIFGKENGVLFIEVS